MKKAWKVVIVIVLIIVLVGAICAGVGMLAGGNLNRIYAELDSQYSITQIYNLLTDTFFSTGMI